LREVFALTKKLWQAVLLLFSNPAILFRLAIRKLRPMRKEYRRLNRLTLRQWLFYHHRHIVFNKVSWMGVPALKNPLDAWVYQEIIYEVKPDIIIEIGSRYGGSTRYFADLLVLLGKGKVVSIDIDRSCYMVEHERIVTITGPSSAPETIAEIIALCRDKSVLLIHDGDHHKEQVLTDLRTYANFVSVNSYLIVEDGIMDLFRPGDGIGKDYDGPLAAVEEFLKENTNFVVDSSRERYILTYNPKGFLKRIS
jgi:cephalosporin hydroxylase